MEKAEESFHPARSSNCIRWAAGLAVLTGWSAYGQWAVYDGAVHGQIITSSAQEIAKMVEQINNQVAQIKTLTDQLNSFNHYVELFGDPRSVNLKNGQITALDLIKPEVGETVDKLKKSIKKTWDYDGQGVFSKVNQEITVAGEKQSREEKIYRPFAAVQQAADNFAKVTQNVAERRVTLKTELTKSLEALQSASTDAQVQKIAASIAVTAAALNSLDHELNQALAASLIQDLENRTEEKRQQRAIREQQQNEFRAAASNARAKFPLLSTPVAFP